MSAKSESHLRSQDFEYDLVHFALFVCSCVILASLVLSLDFRVCW